MSPDKELTDRAGSPLLIRILVAFLPWVSAGVNLWPNRAWEFFWLGMALATAAAVAALVKVRRAGLTIWRSLLGLPREHRFAIWLAIFPATGASVAEWWILAFFLAGFAVFLGSFLAA
jgi:hypothetical protein